MTEKPKRQRNLDLTGQEFGRWTVLSIASTEPKKWLCKCSCGNERPVYQASLRNGHSKSCGCHGSDVKSAWHMKDEIGNVYNGWTVLAFAYSDIYQAARWRCQCVCGDIHVVRANGLRSGRSTQCRRCAARNKARFTREKTGA